MNVGRTMAVRGIMKALEGGAPFVRVGGPQGFLLARRRRGEIIEDPEGHGEFEARESGIFRRFEMHSGGTVGFRWMHLCPCLPEWIEGALSADFDAMTADDLAAISADMAFQAVRAADAARRSEAAEGIRHGRGLG